MKDWLAERAAVTPQKLALMIGVDSWTYGALDTAVSHLTAHLHNQGVRPGQFVAALLPNSLEYVCLIHALARLGAVLVPLNTRLTPAELQWQVDHVGAKWLVTNEEKWSIVNCQLLIVNEETMMAAEPLTIDHWPLTIDHWQSIVFTSGTSGKPKGVPLTFANHFYSAMASAYRLGVQPDDVWLSVLPLYHVGGLAVIFRSCLYGTAVSLHPRFHLDAINHDLDNNPITLISLVPTMLHRLLQTRTHWPPALRLILLGGAAAPVELVKRANALPRKWSMVNSQLPIANEEKLTIGNWPLTIDHSPPLVATTYGLTEASSQVATMLPADAARKPGSVGKPLMFTQVKIVHENGEERPSNQIGEVVVTGPTVMVGYWNAECGMRNAESSIHTGDMGYLDDDGDLWIVQRRSDLIVTGGENVYPAEVEGVLRGHTAVTEACVVGIPDAEWGQRVAAMVQVQPGQTVTQTDLIAFCRQQLAGYKVPRLVQLVDALPLTASGKIARKQVQQLLQNGDKDEQ
ncbi:MAG: AMP-binding protein [Ardenticatenaceae bacterium]|nr:AMP-binding protein [Anaerolineales bacterium]MCB8922949.1 AMP-binding protein [Ardenticatenaceae bacterium]MCB8990318.1 AMP-binding protein [Ardenticatenaceae bacterium]